MRWFSNIVEIDLTVSIWFHWFWVSTFINKIWLIQQPISRRDEPRIEHAITGGVKLMRDIVICDCRDDNVYYKGAGGKIIWHHSSKNAY